MKDAYLAVYLAVYSVFALAVLLVVRSADSTVENLDDDWVDAMVDLMVASWAVPTDISSVETLVAPRVDPKDVLWVVQMVAWKDVCDGEK